MTNRILLVIFLSFLVCSQFIVAQNSDAGPNSVTGVGSYYGITPGEESIIRNQTHTTESVPAEILQALEEARHNEDFNKMEELNNLILEKYSEGVRLVGTAEYQNSLELPIPDLNYSSGFEYDWMDNDVLVDTGNTSNYQRRGLDLKYGDDGNMYLAHLVNVADYRGIRVLRSTDDGQNWSYIGGIYYPSLNRYIMTLSMLVDIRGTTNDSTRVLVYYNSALDGGNNGSNLAFFSFNPATSNYVIKVVDNAPSARKFNYVSAVSDGQYWTSATYLGCIVGEYSNDGDSLYNIDLYRTTDWGDTHSSVSLPFASSTWVDRFPSVAFLPGSGFATDSIMIVTERDFSGYSGIRAFITDWSTLTSDYRSVFITSSSGTIDYQKPVVAVKQGIRGEPLDVVITCTKDSLAVYHSSENSGLTWNLDFTLDQRTQDPQTTYWTHVSSDSMGSSGDFIAIFSNFGLDSINVRRGTNGNLGSTNYMVNSEMLTGVNPPVCAIYRDGSNNMSSSVAYWAFGPNNIYYDGENLITNVSNNEIDPVMTYELFQNYPNPFNPSTKIKFNIPEESYITLKVYDILGNEVANIAGGVMQAGQHDYNFNAKNLSSGIYLYKLEAKSINEGNSFIQTRKMLLLK